MAGLINAQPSADYLQYLDQVLRGTAPVLSAPKIGLIGAPISLSVNTKYADLVQPIYTTYAEVAAVLDPVRVDPQGNVVTSIVSVPFQPTANTGLPIQIYGSYLIATVSMATVLLFSGLFVTPFNMQNDLSGLDVKWYLQQTNQASFQGFYWSAG